LAASSGNVSLIKAARRMSANLYILLMSLHLLRPPDDIREDLSFASVLSSTPRLSSPRRPRDVPLKVHRRFGRRPNS